MIRVLATTDHLVVTGGQLNTFFAGMVCGLLLAVVIILCSSPRDDQWS